jgi:hypothetical protein
MELDGSCRVFLVCTQGPGGNLLRQQQRPKQRKQKPSNRLNSNKKLELKL